MSTFWTLPHGHHVVFGGHRLVVNAGLLLPATLVQRLGLHEQTGGPTPQPGRQPGLGITGDKPVPLVVNVLAEGDCIDGSEALRSDSIWRVLLCTVKAPSTMGSFLRSLRWGHVRQLDRVSRDLLARAWAWDAGAEPGDAPLSIDLDSTICQTYGLAERGVRCYRLHRPAGLSPVAGRGHRHQ